MTPVRTGFLALMLLAMLLAPLATLGKGGGSTVWRSNAVRVRIYTTANWQPLILRTIADYNAVMPERGPTLIPIIQPEHSCTWVRKQRFKKPTITICSQPDANGLGTTTFRSDHGTFAKRRVKIQLVGDPGNDRYQRHQNTVCHEMLHALAGAEHAKLPDDTIPRPDSCLLGRLDAPGPWDIAYLEQAYARSGKRGR